MAIIYSGLDEKDQAFEWLNRGFQSRAPLMVELQTVTEKEFWFKNISTDTRYMTLLNKIKFPKTIRERLH